MTDFDFHPIPASVAPPYTGPVRDITEIEDLYGQRWTRETFTPLEWMDRRDGKSWDEQPRPFFIHACRPAVTGFMRGNLIARCACGGIRIGFSPYWGEKNSRIWDDIKQRWSMW